MNKKFTDTDGKLRVVIASTSEKVNNGLQDILADLTFIHVDGVANSTIKLLSIAENLKPDLILLDFKMDVIPLSHTIQVLKGLTPCPVVVVLSHKLSSPVYRRCQEAGAEYIINKTGDYADLDSVLYTIHSQKIQKLNKPDDR